MSALVAILALGAAGGTTPGCDFAALVREERRLEARAPGGQIFTMLVRAPGRRRGAVVFTHGAGSGGSASWDLQAGDHSFMRHLACAGFDAYAFDARGFGGSSRPAALDGPAEGAAPVVRATDAAEDLDVVVEAAIRTSTVGQVDVIGWSWGSDVAGLYAGQHPERVHKLVLMSPVYDRRWPARHRSAGAWYPLARADVERLYAPEREAHAVWEEFVASLFRFSPDGGSLRLPSGPYRDLYGSEAPVWDAHKVAAPTLVLRGDQDPASLEPNAYRLFERLDHAASRRFVVLGGFGHFLFREHEHSTVMRLVADFLTGEP